MTAILIYMVKVALYMAAFYLVYALLLSKDTYYARNRGFLIISILASFILPAITVATSLHPDTGVFGRWLSGVTISGSSEKTHLTFSAIAKSLPAIMNSIYLAGVAVFIIRILFDLLNLIFLIIRKRDKKSRIIRFHTFNTSGFSALGYIFINTGLNREEEAEIIRHEQNHLDKNHFYDILFIELIMALQWFNPAIYLLNRSLRAVHEYQADQECLRSGATVAGYQNLMLKQVFRTGTITLLNSFSNPSLIKKRMVMMTKSRSSSLAAVKMLAIIPVTGLVFLLVSTSGKATNVTDKTPATASEIQTDTNTDDPESAPFVAVEQMPLFPGGDAALLRYIAENTSYPQAAKENGIQGRVIIRFCVTESGRVNKISILKGVSPELDAEAIRVVGTLPRFSPGKQGGKAVPVWYMVPITFGLR